MDKEIIGWKMNGKDYVGRLGVKELKQLEAAIGAGIYGITAKLGVTSTSTILALAALKMNPKLDAESFDAEFESEMDKSGLTGLSITAMDLLKASGALGREADEKKG